MRRTGTERRTDLTEPADPWKDSMRKGGPVKKIIRFFKSKAFYVVSGLIIQVLILLLFLFYFSRQFILIYYLMVILSAIVAIVIAGKDQDSSSRLLWIFVILALPVFGGILYLLFGSKKIPKALMIKDRQAYADYKQYARQNMQTLKATGKDQVLDKMVSMAWTNGFFPVYEHCQVRYFPTGQEQCQAIIEAMARAEKFIFVETFILDNGRMWDSILKVMIEKAKEGVDVRFIYDDFGAFTHMQPDYDQWLESQGIKTHVFNPLKPQLAMQMNNRDHRKIIVIDGKTAFTGGINIADEYVNMKKRFGYWKDMGIEVRGKAVEQFTISFLQIWNYQAARNTRYADYVLPDTEFRNPEQTGFVIPFFDAPTDENDTGKNMHMNMFNLANKYLWITTPYLVIDAEMIATIKLAAANGVDVRILVPGIPDKKMVYAVTRSNFEPLIRAGVRIYEYTPGFIHGKVCLSDDENALVGTVNMDSRSYYINYECGIWMRKTDCIREIKKDFESMFEVSHEVTMAECQAVKGSVRFYRDVLKLFSPIL